MLSPPLPLNEEGSLSRQLTLPVEDRPPRLWNGSSRWFRSANIIDLWRYRTRDDHRRELVHQAAAKLSWAGVPHGIIGAGLDRDHDAPVNIRRGTYVRLSDSPCTSKRQAMHV
jgi:hypothetical protein